MKPNETARESIYDLFTERDVNLLNGEEFVRITYRPKGERRWIKVCVFPDDGQSLEEVEALAYEIAEAHHG